MTAPQRYPTPFIWYEKNTAIVFPLLDSSGDLKASATNVQATISISGAAFAASINSVTEIGDGFYFLNIDDTEVYSYSTIVLVTADDAEPYWEVLYPVHPAEHEPVGHPVHYGGELLQDTAVRASFMLVDPSTGEIVSGLGTSFTFYYTKNDGTTTWYPAATRGENGAGWYYVDLPASAVDTVGPLLCNAYDNGIQTTYASLYFAVVADAGGVDEEAIADAVWDEAMSGHTTDGTAGQKLGLINTSQVTTASYLTGLSITFPRAVTFDETLSGLTIPSDWDVIYFTVKTAGAIPENDDERAMIQILETNGGDAGDGLQRLNGQDATADKAYGSLTIDQGEGTCQIAITDEMLTLLAAATGLQWDLKYIDTSGDSGLIAQGTASIINTVTMALS